MKSISTVARDSREESINRGPGFVHALAGIHVDDDAIACLMQAER